MRGVRRVCRPGSHCAVRRSNWGGSRCAEQCVFEARPLGTGDCGHLGEGFSRVGTEKRLWGADGAGKGLWERSWARAQVQKHRAAVRSGVTAKAWVRASAHQLRSEGLSLSAPAPSCSNLQARLAALSTGGRGQCCRGRAAGAPRQLALCGRS